MKEMKSHRLTGESKMQHLFVLSLLLSDVYYLLEMLTGSVSFIARTQKVIVRIIDHLKVTQTMGLVVRHPVPTYLLYKS